MSNLKEIKLNKVCRTCLSSSEDTKSLYATDFGLTHVCFAEMLMSFTPLKLSLNDGFPTQICCICISELNQFHTFQLKCLRSEHILRNCKNKMVRTEKISNFEEVLIQKELPIYTDISNEFDENLTDIALDHNYTTTKSLEDPLTIADTQTDSSEEFDLIKQAFDDINIETEAVINTPINEETAKIPGIQVESLSQTRVKSLDEMNKFGIGNKLYACTECDSMLPDEKRLATHKRTHIRDKPYSCTKCHKSFTRNISLLRHIRSHNEESSSDSSRCSNLEMDQSCAATKSLHDPLSTAEIPAIQTRLKSLDAMNKFGIGNKLYACTECDSMFADKKSLATHKTKHIKVKRFPCNKCSKSFTRKNSLLGHKLSHRNESISVRDSSHRSNIEIGQSWAVTTSLQDPLSITEINKELSQELDIKHEIIDVKIENEHDTNNSSLVNLSTRSSLIDTSVKLYPRTICGRMLKTNGILQGHRKTHTGEKPHTCTVCNKSFATKPGLTIHMFTHTGEKPYACTICDRSFSAKNKLTVHMRNHTGERPYTCTECNKSFTCKQYLKSHIGCTLCVKRFTIKQQLTGHVRHHAKPRPYQCRKCNKSFKSQEYLTSHILTHAKVKRYACTLCAKRFTLRTHLLVHLRTHTCSTCNKSYRNPRDLRTHMLQHTGRKLYGCSVCDRFFALKYSLTVHMRSHTEVKLYACPICNRTFNDQSTLTKHLPMHSKYPCTSCADSFAKKYLLKEHLKTHTGE